MDLQPTLIGRLLTLRPLAGQDFPTLFSVASDPRIWEIHPVPDRYKEDVFRVFFDSGIASGGALVVIDNATGEIIGSSRYYDLDETVVTVKTVKIGYTFLARRCWGGGFNTEMKGLMLDHAFRTVETVRFEVGETNFRSRRDMEKLGATPAGTTVVDGKPYVVYAIWRDKTPLLGKGGVDATSR